MYSTDWPTGAALKSPQPIHPQGGGMGQRHFGTFPKKIWPAKNPENRGGLLGGGVIANVLRTVDPQALGQPCGRDSWPILGGLHEGVDETVTCDRGTFRRYETPAAGL